MVDKVTRQIQEEIAAKILGVLAPAAAVIIIICSVAIYWIQPEQYTRIIPSGVAVLLLLVDCWLIRQKRMLAAANLFIFLICLSIVTAMTLNGGVYAPIYTTVLVLVAIVAWLYGLRATIIFCCCSTAIGGFYVWMQALGWLPHIDRPSPLLLWILISCYQVGVLAATAIPNTMLFKALEDSERRRQEAVTAQERERLIASDLACREEQLRLSEERLRYLANNIPSAVLYEITMSQDGSRNFTYVGENIEKVFNITAEQVMEDSRLLYSMIHPDDLESLDSAEQESLGEMSLFQHESRFLTPGGKTIWCRISSTPTAHEDGSITWNGLILDISREIEAEKELASTRGILETAIAQSPAGILIADGPDVTIRMANPAALRIRGDFHDQLRNIECQEQSNQWNTFRPDGTKYPVDQLPLSRAVLEGKVTHNEEVIIVDNAGERHWVSANAAPIRDALGQITAGIVVFTDITDQKKAEEEKENLEVQLRQSQKLEAIGQLAGGIAHDFNNILTAILGNLELSTTTVRQHMGNDHNVIESLEEIEKSARRASTLTRQLLAFSRKEVHQPKYINLNQVLTDMNTMLQRLITAKIDLQTITQEDIKTIHADTGQIEQIIMNLVVNAADAMPQGGKITLSTKNVILDRDDTAARPEIIPGPYVLLAVHDTGHGMDESIREHIFEPFFTTKPRHKGTGLGLSMVYGIIKQSDGHIDVDSELGVGTTFKLFFPAAEGTAQSANAANDKDADHQGTETILLCEDNESVRNIMNMFLSTAGYTVLNATKGSEAIQLAQDKSQKIDLLLTDVILPDTDGLELSKTLQAIHPNLPILFTSGYTSDVITTQGILPEDMDFLEKPFTQDGLLSRVRSAIEKAKEQSP